MHPQIYIPDQKELHFFTAHELTRQACGPGDAQAISKICHSLDDYNRHYAGVKDEISVGDTSPSYFYYAHCVTRITSVLGQDVKIVLLFRDPVDRAFSNYLHMLLAGRENLDFYDALCEEPSRAASGWGDLWRYEDHSRYYKRLRIYGESIPPEQLKIIFTEDLLNNRVETLRGVLTFLGVDPAVTPSNLDIEYNSSHELSRRDNPTLLAAFRMAASILPRGLRHRTARLYHRTAQSKQPEGQDFPVDPRAVDRLIERLWPDVQRIRAYVGHLPTQWRFG